MARQPPWSMRREPMVAHLSLPRVAHVPGTGSKPDRVPLDAAKALVPRQVSAVEWETNEPYRYGVRLCLEGFFWEAHEVWEAVWMACLPNGLERRLLRALIQLANAALKLRMGRINAAARLLAEADELLRDCDPGGGGSSLMGIDLGLLRRGTADALGAAKAGGEVQLGLVFHPIRGLAKPWTQGVYAL